MGALPCSSSQNIYLLSYTVTLIPASASFPLSGTGTKMTDDQHPIVSRSAANYAMLLPEKPNKDQFPGLFCSLAASMRSWIKNPAHKDLVAHCCSRYRNGDASMQFARLWIFHDAYGQSKVAIQFYGDLMS